MDGERVSASAEAEGAFKARGHQTVECDAFCALFSRTLWSPSLPSSPVARSQTANMATFSPAPRRNARYSSVGMSPSPPRFGPTKRTRAGSAQPQSRFSTPRRGGHFAPIRDDESVASGSGMDVDEETEMFEHGLRADAVFSKSKEMTVTFYAQLPMEVRQALRNAGASLLMWLPCTFVQSL